MPNLPTEMLYCLKLLRQLAYRTKTETARYAWLKRKHCHHKQKQGKRAGINTLNFNLAWPAKLSILLFSAHNERLLRCYSHGIANPWPPRLDHQATRLANYQSNRQTSLLSKSCGGALCPHKVWYTLKAMHHRSPLREILIRKPSLPPLIRYSVHSQYEVIIIHGQPT